MLAPRPTGSSGAISVERGQFRRAGDRAAGADRAQQVGEAEAVGGGRRGTVDSACHRSHQRRTANSSSTRTGAGAGDAGQVVAFQVDDHHVLGAFLGARRAVRARPAAVAGRVPLIGRVITRPSRDLDQGLRRRAADGPAVAGEHAAVAGAGQRGRAGAGRARVAGVRRGGVADDVDLVDVAAGDGRADRVDGGGVLGGGPALAPLAEPPRSAPAPGRVARVGPWP